MDDKIRQLLDEFPFLSIGSMNGITYLGIVQNCDNQILSMYVLEGIPTPAMRKEFLNLGEFWWWQSNRQIPINIFIGPRMAAFRDCLKHFPRKDFVLEVGPAPSLQDTIARRVRRRQVMLVKKMPPQS